jgi:hypothetical protein
MKRSRISFCALLLTSGLCLHATRAAGRQPDPLPTELSWIGLYNAELLDWLENGNRLDALCGKEGSVEERDACRAANMGPKIVVIPARAEPRADAPRLGEIVIVAMPGTGLKAFASAGPRTEPFTPDLYDSDWGYGPFFHETVLAHRGSWFRVPLPLIGTAWIDATAWNGKTSAADLVRTLEKGDIVTTPRGDMTVLGVEDHVLRVRPEQKADLWCEGGTPPALAPWTEARIPFRELFDGLGHLLIHYKYTRGC